MKHFVTYLRVSTQKQGAHGLGINSQRDMCARFVEQNKGTIEQEFIDVESGTHRDRKGLWEAIDYCKKNDCSLVIAKLDRLARDVEFTFKVINTGIDIHFTDMPVVNSMILGVFSAVAQYEREMCSSRTRQALAVKKAQGAKLGAANEKYVFNRMNKERQKIEEENKKRGDTKNRRHLESRETQAFLKIIKNVFVNVCVGDPMTWEWWKINTKGENKTKVLKMMHDYHELDNTLFRSWDFTDLESRKNQVKLASAIGTLHRSLERASNNK